MTDPGSSPPVEEANHDSSYGSLNCTECSHKNCLFRFCSKESMNKLNRYRQLESYRKGQLIFREGSPVWGIYIINSGKVKVFRTGQNSKDQIIRLAGCGDIIGHRGLACKSYSITAMALEDTTVNFLDSNVFDEILKTDNSLTYHLMMFYCSELQQSENRMKNLAQMSVREKVLDALIFVHDAFGTETEEGVLLDVDLSRNEYGDISSLRSEQVVRCFAELKEENLIRLTEDKKIILVNPGEVRAMLAHYR